MVTCQHFEIVRAVKIFLFDDFATETLKKHFKAIRVGVFITQKKVRI